MSGSQSLMTPLEVQTRSIFTQANYFVSDKHVKTAAFDFVAVNSEIYSEFYLCKTLSTLDNFKKDHSIELRLVAELMAGFPLLISNRTSTDSKTEDNAVYFRHGIPGLNLTTLRLFLKQNFLPRFLARRGGLYVRIDSNRLQTFIEESGKTITDISNQVDISRKTLYSYLKGSKFVSKDYVSRLATLFDVNLEHFTQEVDMQERTDNISESEQTKKKTAPKNKLQQQVDDFLKSLEREPIDSFWFSSVPFDGLSKIDSRNKASTRIQPFNFVTGTTLENLSKRDLKRMKTTAEIIKSLHNKDAIWIVETQGDITEGSPVAVITIDELECTENLEEFLNLLKEKRLESLKQQSKQS